MNRDEAIDVITALAAAWPHPEWEEARIELWVAALGDGDAAAGQAAVVQAVRELERCPTVAWMLEAMDAFERRADVWSPPELEQPVATKERALAGLAAARAALQGERTSE